MLWVSFSHVPSDLACFGGKPNALNHPLNHHITHTMGGMEKHGKTIPSHRRFTVWLYVLLHEALQNYDYSDSMTLNDTQSPLRKMSLHLETKNSPRAPCCG